jgi:hypothetical protein
MQDERPHTLPEVLRFWAPLAATWLMMAAEGPFLTALVARLVEPRINLAAHGVAYALALVVEGPVIMMMSASTALVVDRASLRSLRRFTYQLNAAVTLLMVVLLVPPVFHALAEGLIGLTPKLASTAYLATALLLPWPAAIGDRRFHQGLLIRAGRPRLVAQGTLVRLAAMATIAGGLYLYADVGGAVMASAALSGGVIAEALAARVMAADVVRELELGGESEEGRALDARKILAFYTPLALTSMLALGVQPVTTFFVGHARLAQASLAVLPVVGSLVFTFRALGLAYQEVAITLLARGDAQRRPVNLFALLLGAGVTLALGGIAWTPLAGLWFGRVAGVDAELTALATDALRILAIMPALTVLLSYQRAQAVHARKTGPVSTATMIELASVGLVLFAGIMLADLRGAIAAAIALVAGRLLANAYLGLKSAKALV